MISTPRIELLNPFPGLRPFREGEEHLFFGRESQVDTMVDKLARNRFLAVVGTSGTGKSSLVNCGLRPALHRGLMAKAGSCWRIAQFRPGNSPLQSMAQALAKSGVLFSGFASNSLSLEDMIEATLRMSNLGLVDIYEQAQLSRNTNLLVIADQFEELFRYQSLSSSQAGGEQDRSQEAAMFVNLLLEAKAQTEFPIYTVLTMRSDFLGDCAEFARLPEAVNEGQYLVPRMTREERRAAIAGPVKVGGGEMSPVLLTRLVNDVGDNPDQLSILQHALNRTWSRWQHEGHGEGELDLAHYEAIGTMLHALDQHAEKAYSDLESEQQRKICERVFKALTDKATDPRGVRRPTRFSTLCALTGATPAELTEVIDVFRKPSRSFLMPPLPEALGVDTVIDISHESLMRVWERLKAWADQEAQSAQLFLRLVQTAALHAQGKAGLYRNPDLSLALEWRDREHPTEEWARLQGGDFAFAMNFLASSEAQQDKEIRDTEERQKRELDQAQALAKAEEQAHSAGRLRQLTLALTIVFIIAVGFAMVARFQQSEAEKQKLEAERQKSIADGKSKIAEDNTEKARAAEITAKEETKKATQAKTEAERLKKEAESLEEKAEKESKADEKRKYEADSERLAEAAVYSTDKDPELGVLLAHEAAEVTNSLYKTLIPEAEDALRRTTQGFRLKELNISLQAATPWAVSFTEDSKQPQIVVVAQSGKDLQVSTRDILSDKPNPPAPLSDVEPATIRAITISPDGKYLAVATQDKYARLWSISSGSLLRTIAHTDPVISIAFTHDGKLLITGTDDEALVWDTTTGSQVARLPHQGRVTALAASPDKKWLATISQPAPNRTAGVEGLSTVTLWPDFTVKKEDQKPKSEHVNTGSRSIRAISFVDAKRLAMATSESTVIIQNVTANKLDVAAHQPPLQIPHERDPRIDIRAFAFSPDGSRLATVSLDKRIAVWSTVDGNKLFEFPVHSGNLNHIAFSPDGQWLAAASHFDKNVRIWSMLPATNLIPATNSINVAGHSDGIYRIAFSADGRRFATASKDKTAKLWNAVTGESLRTLGGHDGEVMGIAFSPDGKRVATGSADGTTRIWDAATGKELCKLTGHKDQVRAVAFHPDGTRLATASWDKTVKIWDTRSGKEILSLSGHLDHVEDVAFSPDGKWLASASTDKTARVWETSTGQPRPPLKGHGYWVLGVAFSPDSHQLATVSADRTGIIWEVPSGKRRIDLRGHTGMVQNVVFSPDARQVATASEDNTARIWDATSGQLLFTFSDHKDKVFGIAFSPDGSRLATTGADGKVFVYAWGGKEIMQLASISVKRPLLTDAECRQYKVESPHCKVMRDVEEGRALVRSGNIEDAIRIFTEAKKREPNSIGDPRAEAEKTLAAVNRAAAHELIALGQDQALSGDIPSAVEVFRKAKALDRTLDFDPKTQAGKLYATTQLRRGQDSAQAGNIEKAIAAFQEAKELDPALKIDPNAEANRMAAEHFVSDGNARLRGGNLEQAMAAYMHGIKTYGQVPSLDRDGSIRAEVWNTLCWEGSLRGHAAAVMGACERAVKDAEQVEPGRWNSRDSRGLARALTGNIDGAIEDFEFYSENTQDPQHKKERQEWVAKLRGGVSPSTLFTSEMLKTLSNFK